MSSATTTEPKTVVEPDLARVEPRIGEHRFLIYNVGWEGYEKLLDVFGDHGPRMNYSGGSVELMSPHIPHERFKHQLAFMVDCVTEELDIPCNALGSTTFKRKLAGRGLEPDECYYIANAGRIVNQRSPDLEVDPPPDLAIEIEITNSLLDKLGIYAGIGVPELWRFDGTVLSVLLLRPDRSYAKSETSRSFPFLPMAELVRFLGEFDPSDETGWRRRFRHWTRDIVLPIYRAAQATD